MADEITTTEPPVPTDRPLENAYAEAERKRVAAEQQAADAAKQLREMTNRLEELENRDKSELEKERAAREKFQREYETTLQRVTKMERASWVRTAAAEHKFDDPSDAVAFLDLDGIEDAHEAEKQVKALAKRKPRLLRDESPPAHIGQQVQNGQRIDPNQPQPVQNPEAEQFLQQVRQGFDQQGWVSTGLE